MIKTIKVKKKLRLDELIKYVWDEDFSVRGYTVFRSDCDNFEVRVSTHKLDYVWDNTSKFSGVPRHTTFTVEVEEEVTEGATFERLVTLGCRGTINVHDDKSLSDLSGKKEYGAQVFALINGKLELIWEAE